MPSINIDLNYLDHPKVQKLVGLLGEGSELYPIRLWIYCGKYHMKDGRLNGYSEAEIESIAKWRGEHGKMLQALLNVGFVKSDKNGYFIHDWNEHEGHLQIYKKRGELAAKERWKDKAKNKINLKNDNEFINASSIAKNNLSIAVSNAKAVQSSTVQSIQNINVKIPLEFEPIRKEIELWLEYKKERKETYKSASLSALWSWLQKIEPDMRAESINFSIASSYSGIYKPKQNSISSFKNSNDNPAYVKPQAQQYDTRYDCGVNGCRGKIDNNTRQCSLCDTDEYKIVPNQQIKIALKSI